MCNIAERCRNIAHKDKDVSFLLLGETGVGKNVLARFIHEETPNRCSHLFVEPSLSRDDNLFDSELFGHKKGAFTGAYTNRIGAFTRANDGTIFLDEIGDVSPQGQLKLLKVVDERRYLPLGAADYLATNARIIATTNKSLTDLQAGTYFRSDLYYRLSAETVVIPPLRERVEDIVPLAEHFMNGWNVQHHTSYVLDNDDKALLVNYSFPGNVRELNNIVCHTARLSEVDFNTNVLATSLSQPTVVIASEVISAPTSDLRTIPLSLNEVCQKAEREHIKKIWIITNCNISHAAKLLKISRSTLREKIRLYGLDRPPDNLLSRTG